MRDIWTEQRKLEIWLQIELLAAEALVAEGLVPPADFAQMKAKAAFTVERCKELEKTLNHDVVAFTTNVSENIGAPASRWLHFGLTSSDIVDTAFAVQMTQSADLLMAEVKALREVIARKAREHQFTPMIGRSHGIHAEPITFGLKMALMHDEFTRALERLQMARATRGGGQTFRGRRHQRPSFAAGGKLRLRPIGPAPGPRGHASGAARFARRVHQRPGRDRREHRTLGHRVPPSCSARKFWRPRSFSPRGKKVPAPCRTSAIPSPANASTGLARVLRGNAVAALENVALWHERDISHSSVERIIFPDSCTLLDYMLATLRKLTEGLIVYPENMKRNLALSLGLWNSQTVLLALIKKGLTREAAYELVQRNAMQTWQAKHAGRDDADFLRQLRLDPEVNRHFAQGELEKLCCLDFHFENIPAKFDNVFGKSK